MSTRGPGPGEIRPSEVVAVRPAPGKGRGVFATRAIASGTTIEVCPVIVLSESESARIEETILDTYSYAWRADRSEGAIVLGFGFLYNHSYEPNARYLRDFEAGVMDFVAIRDIQPGEEITINYNGNPASREPVWFELES